MSKEYLEVLDTLVKVTIIIGMTFVIYFLSAIYLGIKKQNKWLMEDDEINNIGK